MTTIVCVGENVCVYVCVGGEVSLGWGWGWGWGKVKVFCLLPAGPCDPIVVVAIAGLDS